MAFWRSPIPALQPHPFTAHHVHEHGVDIAPTVSLHFVELFLGQAFGHCEVTFVGPVIVIVDLIDVIFDIHKGSSLHVVARSAAAKQSRVDRRLPRRKKTRLAMTFSIFPSSTSQSFS